MNVLDTKIKRHVSAFFIILSLAVFQFRSVITPLTCMRKSVGLFGDAYSTMWTNWVMAQYKFDFWNIQNSFISYPDGEKLWSFDWWTSVLVRVPLLLTTKLTNEICAYNLIALLGVVLSSYCVWFLADNLTKNFPLSIFASFYIGFGPFIFSALSGHINYVFSGLYALAIYVLLKMPTLSPKKQTFSALILGLFSYLDGYYFVPIGSLLSFYLLSALILRYFDQHRLFFSNLKIKYILVTYISAHLPLVWLFLMQTSSQNDKVVRDWNELTVYSIRYWHLLTPHPSNSYYSPYFENWQDAHLGGSNFSETGLFLGFGVISILTLALLKYLKSLKFQKGKLRDSKNLDTIIFFLLSVTFVGILIAMRPIVHLGGINLPFPSGILFNVLPVWRTISRWGFLATIALVVLAIYILAKYVETKSSKIRNILLIFFISVGLIDVGFPGNLSPKVETVVRDNTVYEWIDNNTNKKTVILDVVPYSVDGFVTNLALTSKRRLSNFLRIPQESWRNELLYPGMKTFACALERSRTDYVILHPNLYKINSSDLENLTFVKEFKSTSSHKKLKDWFNARLYRYIDNQKLNYQVNYTDAFVLSSQDNWNAKWLQNKSRSHILISKIENEKVSFTVENEAKEFVNVKLQVNNELLWTGLLEKKMSYSLDAKNSKDLNIEISLLSPGSTRVPQIHQISVEFTNSCGNE